MAAFARLHTLLLIIFTTTMTCTSTHHYGKQRWDVPIRLCYEQHKQVRISYDQKQQDIARASTKTAIDGRVSETGHLVCPRGARCTSFRWPRTSVL